ncbi:hypothetical protein HOY34_11205 [Xinfangfangia sp. D13-10-4-6]|uniref:hypothetical protein n=1 Tax=Pseudogemmobacter hezensis TaxID=2737662 RepID=UPI001553F74E|nr:hypothetical protein [Pseudogemmobacter hezensis]NPD15770.1 hypothetical protein [Pseudogemmobacter hezensis]
MSDILDALDELASARDMLQLLEMTTRYQPDNDRKALGAGCEAALARLNAGISMLYASQRAEAG